MSATVNGPAPKEALMKEASITFNPPSVVYVDEDHSVKPPAYGTIDKLMQSLKENGPLIAMGHLGPSAYTEDPVKVRDTFLGKEVFGWRDKTSKDHSPTHAVVLLGAKKTDKRAYVYFTLGVDITSNEKSFIRGYKPSPLDTKIYVMSYNNFLKRALVDLHPVCPHGEWLFSTPVNTLLDRGAVEQRCRAIGQEIFDHYKAQKWGSSEAGKEAVQRICEAALFLSKDPREGAARKGSIERVWNGIGDATWRWRA